MIFYKWMRGCAPGAGLTSGCWSYWTWGNTLGQTVDALPRLKVASGKLDYFGENSAITEYDLGYVLTNKVPNAAIEARWTYKNLGKQSAGLILHNNYWTGQAAIIGGTNDEPCIDFVGNLSVIKKQDSSDRVSGFEAVGSNGNLYVQGDTTMQKDLIVKGNSKLGANGDATAQMITVPSYSENGIVSVHSKLNVAGTTKLGANGSEYALTIPKKGVSGDAGHIKAQNILNASAGFKATYGEFSSYIKTTGSNAYIEAKSYCKAKFFTATSDIRAKENIEPATYDALELIKKLTVYNFNYKNDKERLTGIMAQDLLKVQPKDLDLVSNPEASGENDDYMSIKNDKLMFVLMKAIQEQQEQIEALKAEIEKLKV